MASLRDYYDEKDSGLLFSIIIAAFIIANFLMYSIAGFIGGAMGIAEENILKDAFLKWFIQGGMYILLALVVLVYFKGAKLNIVKSNGLNVRFKLIDYLMLIVIAGGMFLTLLIVNYFYSFFLQEIGYVSNSISFDINNAGTFIAAIFIMCILPAVVEETVFRGAALNGFSKVFSARWAIVLSALLFMLMHMNIPQFVNAFLCGLILAVLAKKTGSIIPGMIVHFINNFIIVLISFIASFGPDSASSEKIIIDAETVLALLLLASIGAGLLTAGLIYIYKKVKNKAKPEDDLDDSYLKEFNITNGGITGRLKSILYALTGIVLAIAMTILNLVL